MGLLKGEEIIHKKIRMPGHIPKAVKIIEKIGRYEDDILEFIDLTKNDLEAKKSFLPLIRRCETMTIKLQSLEKFANEFNIIYENYKNYDEFFKSLLKDQNNRKIKDNEYFDFAENEVNEDYKRISDLYESYIQIKENLMIEAQRKITLEKYFSLTAATIIDQNNPRKSLRKSDYTNNIINNDLLNQSQLSNISIDSMIRENQFEPITGVCFARDEIKMKRMIFRVSRDKVLCTFFEAEFPEELKPKEQMKIFVMFCPKIEYLIKKMLNICELYNCSRFEIPENYIGHVMEILPAISEKILEHKNYLYEAKKTLKYNLQDYILIQKRLQLYQLYFRKQKLIYLNLSKCIIRENFIDGEVWILKNKFEKLNRELNIGNDDDSTASFIDVKDYGLPKPTYIQTNDFTFPFQQIVNQYGIPNYGEINPGYFTIITFPFLFGIMFGDVGHGLILLAVTIFLFVLANKGRRNLSHNIISSDHLRNESFEENILDSKEDSTLKMFVQYRYFLLLCSFFAIFCGFMYNEFLSIPLDIFGTCYTNIKNRELYRDCDINEKNNNNKNNCTYPFGLDPSWFGKVNELTFTNSLKMKLSIIIGVLHMLLGLVIRGVNNINNKNYVAFLFEFIPQILFMIILFGYLILMIFYKWSINWNNNTDDAPSLLTLMINMIIKFGSVEDKPLFTGTIFGMSQETLHKLIIIICIILVPIMLFVTPTYTFLKKYRTKGINYRRDSGLIDKEQINNIINNNIDNESEYSLSLSQESVIGPNEHYSHLYQEQRKKYKEDAKFKYQFLEIFIQQLIDTIEYVLSTVSNTASYLRLWALSLAHTALSHVFLEKTFLTYIQKEQGTFANSIIRVFIFFFIFCNVTIFILMFMDAMECLLHTLRLHWVEFQNKFYKGEGYVFEPFSFKYLVSEKS